jgi:hypothetical protein
MCVSPYLNYAAGDIHTSPLYSFEPVPIGTTYPDGHSGVLEDPSLSSRPLEADFIDLSSAMSRCQTAQGVACACAPNILLGIPQCRRTREHTRPTSPHGHAQSIRFLSHRADAQSACVCMVDCSSGAPKPSRPSGWRRRRPGTPARPSPPPPAAAMAAAAGGRRLPWWKRRRRRRGLTRRWR